MAKMAAVHADSAAARGADPQFAMQSFQHVLALTAPLFLLVLIGYALMRWAGWPAAVSNGLTQFVFSIAVPLSLVALTAAG